MLSSSIRAELVKHPYLVVPDGLYHLLTENTSVPFINGCGPSSGFFLGCVSNDIGGIDVEAACIIHDYRYYVGETMSDKYAADVEFFKNLVLIISNDPNEIYVSVINRQMRFDAALLYFRSVHEFGLKPFVDGKNVVAPESTPLEQLAIFLKVSFKMFTLPFKMLFSMLKIKYVTHNFS